MLGLLSEHRKTNSSGENNTEKNEHRELCRRFKRLPCAAPRSAQHPDLILIFVQRRRLAIKWKLHAAVGDDDVETLDCAFGWYIVFSLDAFTEANRIRQLKTAGKKLRALIGQKDVFFLLVVISGRDKNVTLTEEERANTRATKWTKSEKMNTTWKEFLQAIRCEPLEQHEFTWHRIAKRKEEKQEEEEAETIEADEGQRRENEEDNDHDDDNEKIATKKESRRKNKRRTR